MLLERTALLRGLAGWAFVLLTAMGLLSAEGVLSAEISGGQVEVPVYQPSEGEPYFALTLQTGSVPPESPEAHHHAVVMDTSASQVGEHRRQALAVLEAFLDSLPQSEKVTLFAADVQTKRLLEGFVAPDAEDVKTAVTALKNRAPLGASDLEATLQTVKGAFATDTPGSILYIGDGMSTGNLLQTDKLRSLLDQLSDRRIAVHSYVLGPRTDLPLLGLLGHHTGGRVVLDREERSAEAAGEELSQAVRRPVFYPSEIMSDPSLPSLLPGQPLPVRADRASIYLGRGRLPEQVAIAAAGPQGSVKWTATRDDRKDEGPFLAAMWRRAQQHKEVSVPLAGENVYQAARTEFDAQLGRLVAAGQQAVANEQLDQAERVSRVAANLAPNAASVKALRATVDQQSGEKLLAQAEAQPPGDDQQNTGAGDDEAPDQPNLPNQADNPAPAAQPPNPQDPDEAGQPQADQNSLLDQLPGANQPGQGGQPPADGLIDEQQQRIQIRTQQLQVQVSRAIERARELAAEDPDSAIAELKRVLNSTEAATDVNPTVRQQLGERLRNVIQEFTSRREVLEFRQIQQQERQAQAEAEERLIEQMELRQENLEQLIDRVRSLLEEAEMGNDAAYEEAESVAEEAVNVQPGNGPAAAARFTAEAASQVNSAFRLRARRADRLLATLQQVELSHVPFPDEPPIRFPPAEVWKALTERRQKYASVSLESSSPAEEKIQQELGELTELDFFDTPLTEVVDFLAQLHEINIIINEQALLEEGISTDEPINQSLSGITLRSALNIILEPLGLTYVIEDEVMKITTQIDAEEKMSTRVYPVGDLVIPIRLLGGGGMSGGLGGGGLGGGMGGGLGGGMGGGLGGGLGGGGLGGGGLGGGGGFFNVPPEEKPAQENGPSQKSGNDGQQPARNTKDDQTSSFHFDNETVQHLKKKEGTGKMDK